MGGRALNAPTRPLTRSEHVILSAELCSRRTMIRNCFATVASIPSLSEKQVFNDIDLVCGYLYESEDNLRDGLMREFGATEVIFNGNCITFDYRLNPVTKDLLSSTEPGVQVDIRWYRDENEAEFAVRYFSYGDLGNMLGAIFKYYGFKLKDTGLYYKYMNGSEMLEEILVSMRFETALRYIDLDIDRFSDGFRDETDAFCFVADSEYFRPSIFMFENLDSKNRLRNKKRVMYSNFVTWCTNMYPAEKLSKEYATTMELDEFLERAFEMSNSFHDRFLEVCHVFLIRKHMKQYLGGEVIHALTGFTGEKLGRFIDHIKRRYGFGHRGFLERDIVFYPERIQEFVYTEKMTFEEDRSKCGMEFPDPDTFVFADDEEDMLDF